MANKQENLRSVENEFLDQLSDGSKRMNKIEYLLYAVILAVLLGPGVAADFVKKLLGI